MSDSSKAFVTASHAILFQAEQQTRCDVCHEPFAPDVDDDGPEVSGRGMLVWTRGEERRYQEAPLCPACAAAVGVSALARWEIEEEEG